ncbi:MULTISPECIES: phosphoglycerate dehydrogenase [Cupriavidus]|uniref:phosphoglycerate dehydrogenase n=1 Tax=Cupriavidus TaxID=106589 RepID=UPI000674C1B0|nr:phosphoglycerate dehydrogenase [Cupriavidus pinatubonensis]
MRGKLNVTTAILLENIHASATARLGEAGLTVERRTGALAGDELRQVLASHDLVGIRSATHLRGDDIRSAPALLSIGCFCIGTSQVDLDAATAAGIPVFNAPFSNTRSVAELVVSEAVMLLRKIPEKNALAHAGKWAKGASGAFEARGKTIAIVGYGNIGSQVGVLAESMGMRVVYYDVLARLSLGSARAAGTLEEAVSQADVVTLHVPATARTRNMIDAHVLACFKPGAILINASRGTVVDIDALAAALRDKRLGGAAIDVFPEEPKTNNDPFVSPLQQLPNVLLTPHIGGSTEEAQENIGTEVAAKLLNYLNTGGTIGAVNFPEVDPGPLHAPARLLNIHSNAPGALAALNTLLAQDGVNINGQHLQTRGHTGYVVTDLDRVPSDVLMESLRTHAGFVRSRLLVR